MLISTKLMMGKSGGGYISDGLIYHGDNIRTLYLDVWDTPNYTFIVLFDEIPQGHLIEFAQNNYLSLRNGSATIPDFRISRISNGSTVLTIQDQTIYTDRPNYISVSRNEYAEYRLYINGSASNFESNDVDIVGDGTFRRINFRGTFTAPKFMLYDRILSNEELDYNLSVWNEKNGY